MGCVMWLAKKRPTIAIAFVKNICLLRRQVVRPAESKSEALTLKDALDAAGEAEEEQGQHQDHVWIFHFSTFVISFCFVFDVWVRLVFVEKWHDKATHD